MNDHPPLAETNWDKFINQVETIMQNPPASVETKTEKEEEKTKEKRKKSKVRERNWFDF